MKSGIVLVGKGRKITKEVKVLSARVKMRKNNNNSSNSSKASLQFPSNNSRKTSSLRIDSRCAHFECCWILHAKSNSYVVRILKHHSAQIVHRNLIITFTIFFAKDVQPSSPHRFPVNFLAKSEDRPALFRALKVASLDA